ncbi:response regulator [bacterium]|nr:response regulator [bacterium]MBU1884345.1 response regulator [bacterium]
MTDIQELKQTCSTLSVLYVEDDTKLRDMVSDYLKMFFARVVVAEDGKIGLKKFKKEKFDLVITDIQMPNMNGIEMIEAIKSFMLYQEVIILTAFSESFYFLDAIRLDVSGYLIKPVDYELMNQTLFRITKKIIALRENESYKLNLEHLVQDEVQKNMMLEDEKIYNYEQTLIALVELIERRDTYTGGHSERVATYSKAIASQLGCTKEECDFIYRAGILHDIGKVVTPDAVLLKPGKLEANEYRLIQEHVTAGSEMLEKIPMYKELASILGSHHERYDGKGYPKGLKGNEIPFLSRIMIIADAFDAMTTNRIYKARMTKEEALNEIKDNSAKQFAPELIDPAIEALKKLDITKNTTQMPYGEIEKERFAYFYKDQITGVYNQSYLNLILIQNINSKEYNFITLLNIHNFSSYNQNHSWQSGDNLLKSLGSYLVEKIKESMIFRFEGDDFVILSQNEIDIELDEINNKLKKADKALFATTEKFDVQKKKIFSLDTFENELKK